MEVQYSARKSPPLVTVLNQLSLVKLPARCLWSILLLSIFLHGGLPRECVTVLAIVASLC